MNTHMYVSVQELSFYVLKYIVGVHTSTSHILTGTVAHLHPPTLHPPTLHSPTLHSSHFPDIEMCSVVVSSVVIINVI